MIEGHGPDCVCARCAGTPPPAPIGNQLGVRHGVYSLVQMSPRAKELGDSIRETVPAYHPADEVAISALAMTFAQLERASAVLARRQHEEHQAINNNRTPSMEVQSDLKRLSSDVVRFANAVHRFCDSLGLTPTARARLGLDLVRARAVSEQRYADLLEEGRQIAQARDQ